MLATHFTRFSSLLGLRCTGLTLARRTITTTHNIISDGERPFKGLRRPSRGGQNLSERYKRLENSLRGKDALSRDIRDLAAAPLSTSPSEGTVVTPMLKAAPTFYGFQVPQEPKPPADDECCMSGCAVCIYDLYEESLEEYQAAVSSLRASLLSLKVSENEWPQHIRTKSTGVTQSAAPRKDTILNAFEEMERFLALKKQQQEVEARKSELLRRQQRRTQLVGLEDRLPRQSFTSHLYEGVKWVLFSQR